MGTLGDLQIAIDDKFGATVVVAAGGYPGSYAKGTPMKLGQTPSDVVLFHAGTSLSKDTLQTSGGRVIASTATGETLKQAVAKAYEGVACIKFAGMQYRRDIAARALK